MKPAEAAKISTLADMQAVGCEFCSNTRKSKRYFEIFLLRSIISVLDR